MKKQPVYLLSCVLLIIIPISAFTSSDRDPEEAVIHDTCKKTHMYGHCVQAIHSYELFDFTSHSTPLKLANIIIYVTGAQQALDTLQRINDLISSSGGESRYYIDALKACREEYERIYDVDYFTAWVKMANGDYGASENAMWSARGRANSCERGFDRVGKYPITDMNNKLWMLGLVAVDVIHSLL
uniref:Pectinesterase inhibitor domain-containing protein n=1 Tax=Kalanchoe fedtschenkoi TaxID=63787 RepID=A0A7N0UEM4_KALFE